MKAPPELVITTRCTLLATAARKAARVPASPDEIKPPAYECTCDGGLHNVPVGIGRGIHVGRGGVDDGVSSGEGLLVVGLVQFALCELDMLAVGERLQVGDLRGIRRIAHNGAHTVALGEELFDDVRTDEAVGAGDGHN